MKTLHKKCIALTVSVTVSVLLNCSEPPPPKIDLEYFYPDGAPRTVGFDEVRDAKEGDLVTINGDIDIKGACNNLRESPRDICIAGFMRPGPDGLQGKWDFMQIKVRMCSEQLRTNCMVYPPPPDGHDFRNVYVLDKAGLPIDFDGHVLIEEPNSWTAYPQNVRLTGRVTVIDGEGRFVTPIERIEPE